MESFVSEELLENTFLYCYKRVSNKEAAQDLTQEIVIEALRNVREGRKIENFYAWYWQMAHNKIVRHFQKLQNQALPIDYVETILFASDKTLDQLISSEEIENLNKAISKLAAIHRDIIIRFYLQGQSVKQISKALGLSLGTVTGRLFDARKNLDSGIGKEEILRQNVKKDGRYIVFIPVSDQGDIEDEDYDVFMAIAEKVGKDRRGNVIYEKDDDGAEILFVENKEWASYNRQGELISRHRTERVKHVDDDLPKISKAFINFLEGEA